MIPMITTLKSSLVTVSLTILCLFFISCSVWDHHQFERMHGPTTSQDRWVAADTPDGQHFLQQIKPILDNRCVNCHACYDAPCQLNLASPEGIDRGAHKTPVYSGTRLLADEPRRLFMDEATTEAWRNIDFFPVLNEYAQTQSLNRYASLIYRSLILKKQHPKTEGDLLDPDEYDLSLNRSNECPTIAEYDRFAAKEPYAGMPYGLPPLNDQEQSTLIAWLEAGAYMPEPPPLSNTLQEEVNRWEAFLNQKGNKGRLVSRYLYEHLFLANLYFDHLQEPISPTYFKLVRSETAPGTPIKIIATRRPSDNPNVDRVYYRLQPVHETLISKTHLPYPLNPARQQWIQSLFFTPSYEVTALPPYENSYINPFVTFRELPARSRYRFMLEESQFIIGGFIKGPVCRGQIAVDVINDHFWVFFVDPDTDALPMLDTFVDQQSENLKLPGIDGSTAGIIGPWREYSSANRDYLIAKRHALNTVFKDKETLNEKLIWQGDGDNPNAALTVFRNFDNAVVVKGLVGESPKTAWVIDYPLLERIHYLLTVDFDVYGNVGHQLNTRLYMDFLRIEGEFNFLTLLPPKSRLEVRDHWYRDASKQVKEYLYSCDAYLQATPSIVYTSDNHKEELYTVLKRRLSKVLDKTHHLDQSNVPKTTQGHLAKLHLITGRPASLLAEVTSLLVTRDSENTIGKSDQGKLNKEQQNEIQQQEAMLFTLLSNRAHSNITSLFLEEKNRLPEEDTITVTYGMVGDYPNAFLSVTETELPQLIDKIASMKNRDDYHALMDQFGVRRTDPAFWAHSDRVHQTFKRQQPLRAGVLDYNRIENR